MSSSSRNTTGSTTVSHHNNDQTVIPKSCSVCGHGVSLKASKSESNPMCRYYHWNLAADMKLVNDNHIFKWLDDALLEEVVILYKKNSELRKDVSELFMLLQESASTYRDESNKRKRIMFTLASMVAAAVFASKFF